MIFVQENIQLLSQLRIKTIFNIEKSLLYHDIYPCLLYPLLLIYLTIIVIKKPLLKKKYYL